jgi:hypothetical protein
MSHARPVQEMSAELPCDAAVAPLCGHRKTFDLCTATGETEDAEANTSIHGLSDKNDAIGSAGRPKDLLPDGRRPSRSARRTVDNPEETRQISCVRTPKDDAGLH